MNFLFEFGSSQKKKKNTRKTEKKYIYFSSSSSLKKQIRFPIRREQDLLFFSPHIPPSYVQTASYHSFISTTGLDPMFTLEEKQEW